jgi:hypothetical protein
MSDLDALPEDWVVWNDEVDGPLILAYRPDVFDSQRFPAPCMPTLYLTRGGRDRRPPRPGPVENRGRSWHVTLFLEPEVELDEHHVYPDRETAVAATVDLATRFARGDVDVRDVYQVPREEYLAELETLLGR